MANDNDFDPSSQNYGWFDGAYNNAGWNPASKPAYGAPGGPNPWVRDNQPLFLSGAWGSDPSGTINARSSGLFNSMGDAGANIWQQIGTPVASYMLASRMMNNVLRPITPDFAMKGAQASLWRSFGSAAPRWGLSSNLGYRIGQGLGGMAGGAVGGLSGGLVGFGGFRAGAAAGAGFMGAVGGAAGGLFSALLGPEALLGMGIMQGAQSAIFDPYINRRRMSQAAMTGYANATIEGDGSARYGTGMNNVAAYRMASRFNASAWSDMSMSNNDRAQIAGLSLGNDLMPGVAGGANPAAISKRLDSIVSSTKQTMRALKLSEDKLREVNALLKQFSDSGMGPGGSVNRLMSGISIASKATGFGAMDLMQNEVQRFGSQTQGAGMLFESGALAGTDALARMGALRRRGGVSEAMLGLYGGVSGMAGLAVNAGVTGVSTEYSGLRQFNRYIGGRDTQGLGATLGAFSQRVGANPIAAYGAMIRNRGMMRSADMADNPMGWVSQYAEMNRLFGHQKLTAESFAAMAAGDMGEGEINATLAQIRAMQTGANDFDRQKESEERVRTMMSATGETGWGWEYAAKKNWSGAASMVSDIGGRSGHAGLAIGSLLVTKGLAGGARRVSEMGATALGRGLVRAGGSAAVRAVGVDAGVALGGRLALGALARGAGVGMITRMAAGAGLVAAGIVSAPVVALAGLAYTAYEVANASPELADWAGNTWNKFSYGEQRDRGVSGITNDQNEALIKQYASDLGAKDTGSLQRAFNVNRKNMMGGGDGTSSFTALKKELEGMSPTDPRRKDTIRTMSEMGYFGDRLTEADIQNLDNGLRSNNSKTLQWMANRTSLSNEKALKAHLTTAGSKAGALSTAADMHDVRQVRAAGKGIASKAKTSESYLEYYRSQTENIGKKMQEIEVSSVFDDLEDAMNRGASSSEVSALSARAFGTAVDEFGRYVKGLPGNSLTAGNDNMLKLAAP